MGNSVFPCLACQSGPARALTNVAIVPLPFQLRANRKVSLSTEAKEHSTP